MKFGVKNYFDGEFFDSFVDKCDFFEVQAIRGKDYSFLEKYDLPIVLHCEHAGFGINISNPKKEKDNLESVNFAKELADKYNVKKIIIHPGYIEDENCSKENMINFLNENCDSRFYLENMPFSFMEGLKKFCSTPEEMQEVLEKTKVNFCFDVVHAMIYSVQTKKDYVPVIQEFERLNPRHYHLCGYNFKEGGDHIYLMESTYDLGIVFEIISPLAEITLEIPHEDKEKILDDLKLVGRI
ncbi:TIM barrel protein [archaeon]|nr:TIM barrel protein [archaeon]